MISSAWKFNLECGLKEDIPKLFDVDRLLVSAENDEKWADEILVLYIKDVADRLNAVKKLLSDDTPDLSMLRLHFHTIKSSSASVGAALLGEKAFILEKAAKNYDLELIRNSVGFLGDVFKKSVIEFEKRIKREL
jgi:HPt (histidine-containing phosphotransfer) domain-containing protein